MRKSFLNNILCIISFILLFDFSYSGIVVIVPQTGDIFNVGDTITIQYQATQEILNVGIALSQNGGRSWTQIIRSTKNVGSYPWTIPSSIIGSDTCMIMVYDSYKTNVSGKSGIFSIHNSNTISIVHPNGGEIIPQSPPTYYITWNKKGTGPNVRIDLYKGVLQQNSIVYVFFKTLSPNATNSGKFAWNVVEPPDKYYKIRITDKTIQTVYDESKSNFEIKTNPANSNKSNQNQNSPPNLNKIPTGKTNQNIKPSPPTNKISTPPKTNPKPTPAYKQPAQTPKQIISKKKIK